MELFVKREPSGTTCTIGSLFIEDAFFCYTLEDIVREVPGQPVNDWKIWGKTAIPLGRYQILITYSPHFKEDLPLLQMVPGYEGVRIHPGNCAADTDGCILVGMAKDPHGLAIYNSRIAFSNLLPKIEESLKKEQVWITIQPPADGV